MYICSCTYLQKYTTPERESDARKINKADRFLPICVHIVRIWLVSSRTTCRLGFCRGMRHTSTALLFLITTEAAESR